MLQGYETNNGLTAQHFSERTKVGINILNSDQNFAYLFVCVCFRFIVSKV